MNKVYLLIPFQNVRQTKHVVYVDDVCITGSYLLQAAMKSVQTMSTLNRLTDFDDISALAGGEGRKSAQVRNLSLIVQSGMHHIWNRITSNKTSLPVKEFSIHGNSNNMKCH